MVKKWQLKLQKQFSAVITKAEARRRAKEKRALLMKENKVQNEELLCANLINSNIYKSSNAIFLYSALDKEISTMQIAEDAEKNNKKIAFPRCVNNSGEMKFYFIKSLSELKKGMFGIYEPPQYACEAVPDDSALIIVPGLAFSRSGARIGYGKGYYDRYLSKHRAKSVGLCFEEFIFNDFYTDEFDVSVNYIATQKEITECYPG